ncbi:porin [Parvibaculum sp.]|uniref:OprO/OprP family phosphate-selective porin n=1 Tax=Parvibaculum sp. TaxID=2024848 RepID=UPI00320CA591
MTLRNILLAGTALGAAALLAGPAMAGSAAATQNDINTMKQQIMDLQQRLDDLQIQSGNEIKEIKEKQDAVQIDFKDGKPTFRTGDGLFTMSIRGRAHLDTAVYDQSDSQSPQLSSGANFRRAELGVEGTFMRDWGYKLNMQWGDSGKERASTIKDAYLTYGGIDGITLMAGAIQTPMSLDDVTSSNDITFIERATASNLATSLGAGDGRISFGGRGNTENFQASLFYTMDSVGTSANTSNEGSAVVGRAAFRFKPMDKTNVHIGASGTYKFDPNGSVTFSDRPELRVDPTSIISTGSLGSSISGQGAQSAYAVGPEFAASYGPVRAQAEYYKYKVDRGGTQSDPDFDAWYVQASWVLTGEEYKYSMEEAAYKGVKPASPFTFGGGIGAWEVAARYSVADLNYNVGSGTATSANIRGGEQKILTLGLNWYPINNVRMMFEYLDVNIDKMASNGGNADESHNAFASRIQFAF